MKIAIDMENMEVSVSSDVCLGELFSQMQELFTNGEWKHYRLVNTHAPQEVYVPYRIEVEQRHISTTL
jgi:hypothetical protein